MKNILFVCTGNTCRSPLAEHLLRHKAGDKFAVKSAGIAAIEDFPASEYVDKLLVEKGITYTHQSQPISEELMQWADLILTMTQSHQAVLKQQFTNKAEHIFTLKNYLLAGSDNQDISDPFGGSEEIYRLTMAEIDRLLDLLIEKES